MDLLNLIAIAFSPVALAVTVVGIYFVWKPICEDREDVEPDMLDVFRGLGFAVFGIFELVVAVLAAQKFFPTQLMISMGIMSLVGLCILVACSVTVLVKERRWWLRVGWLKNRTTAQLSNVWLTAVVTSLFVAIVMPILYLGLIQLPIH